MKKQNIFLIFICLFFCCINAFSQNSMYGWGRNNFGQLGDGTNINKSIPTQIGEESYWILVSCGGSHTAAIKSDGTLWTWGRNNYGQLGDGTNIDRLSPVQIGSDNNWSFISAGVNHTLAIKNDGTLWAWGSNYNGQLGDGTNINRLSPVQIGSDNNWTSISAGDQHSIAIKIDSTLWAWGNNQLGQLGNGTMISSYIPIQIGIEDNWSLVTAGENHSLANKVDGTLWAWGFNNYGQLGDGTTTIRTSPVQIGEDNYWVIVSAGANCSFAINNDGTLWAWGYNNYGQLGDETTTNRTTPVQIGTETNWVQVENGGGHTLALKNDGTLWAWGLNVFGQLGDGSTTNRTTPVQIGTETNWIKVNCGYNYTISLSGIQSNLTIPFLISPENNATNQPLSPTIQWQAVENATSYTLQVSLTSEFTDLVVNQSGIETTEFQLNNLEYNTTYFWRVNATDGEQSSDWSEVWSFTTEEQPLNELTINLNSGWNLISSNIVPENTNIIDIFSEVNNLKLVKNQAGNIYDPAFGINTIGNWNINYGYWVYMTAPSILQILGLEVNPLETPINLNQGWNLISYLRNSDMLAPDALQGISGSMLFAKDKMGNLYHPGYGINTLGNMQPGQGYWIYMNAPAVLTFPGN